MKHIKTLNTKNLQNTVKKGGCGECQTSCQSACKTSCTVEMCIRDRKRRMGLKKCVRIPGDGRHRIPMDTANNVTPGRQNALIYTGF